MLIMNAFTAALGDSTIIILDDVAILNYCLNSPVAILKLRWHVPTWTIALLLIEYKFRYLFFHFLSRNTEHSMKDYATLPS
jgi:hypothetical protein